MKSTDDACQTRRAPIQLSRLYWKPSPNKKQDCAGAGTIGTALYLLIAAPFRGMKISAGGVILNFLE
jgi:hypothetical protein